MQIGITALAGLAAVGMSSAALASIQVDFDGIGFDPSQEVRSIDGAAFASQGIVMQSVSIQDNVAVGDTVQWTLLSGLVALYTNADSVSGPGFIGAQSTNDTDDILINFADDNVNTVALHTDLAAEGGEVVRLIALQQTGEGYIVLDIAEGLDNATTEAESRLEVFTGSERITHAIFQTTFEREGFDNLSYGNFIVPAPGVGVVLAGGLLAAARRRR